jgi:hypothetical protein
MASTYQQKNVKQWLCINERRDGNQPMLVEHAANQLPAQKLELLEQP